MDHQEEALGRLFLKMCYVHNAVIFHAAHRNELMAYTYNINCFSLSCLKCEVFLSFFILHHIITSLEEL